MKRAKLLLVCFVLFAGLLRSQIYPVQISAQLVPPYSGYLPDYADPTAEKLKVILQFNDFSQTQYNLKLKFEIKGNGFTISTKALFNPPPITLLPGQPLLLSGADLAPYLNTNNLDFVGINQSQYQQKMALPEGYYSICVKAYDYYNANPIQVSNEACANAWFTLSDPPYLNLPICNAAITPLTPQNIIFQWTPVNMGSPLSALNTEYEFSLYECRPDSNANPNQVVLSTAPIFSTTTQQTSFNYGLAEPPLNLYMKYIWRVRAKDITGKDLFKNNGYSQICTFTYGTVKNVFGNTIGLSLTARPLNHRSGECTWSKQSVYSKYLLQVRKKNTNYWFDFPNTTGLERVPNLEPKTVYECRVRGEAGTLIGEWSDIAEFKTLDPPNYSCNDNTLAPFNSLQPLPPAKAVTGLVIQSGQFEVIATQITANGPPGWYKGKGYAMIFGLLPVAVKWDNIFIDVDQRQQQGIIEALTEGVDKWMGDWETKQAEANATYVDGEIDTVYVSGNSICYKINGNSNVFCTPVPPGVNVVVIRDSEGNQYTVHLQPPPPKVVGPTNYINISSDNLDATDNFKVVFEAELNQNFGFDKKEYAAFMDNYEAIKLSNNKIYFVPNKSIGENSTDAVIATFTINGYSPSQLSFKTQNGQVISTTSSGNNLKLTGIPADANCIYAYCDNKRIGKLNIIGLKQLNKKLVLVPVNGANVNLTASDLNAIYKQANVVWTVTTTTGFSFSLGNDGLENADATLMSKYSTEMRALRDAYKAANSNYDKDAYYVFVVPNFADATTVGYMVRGRALGFVRTNASAKEIAHELAHGAFGLEHTFPSAEKESTNNLLDYTNGAVLLKGQWEDIHSSKPIFVWDDSEESGSFLEADLENYFNTSAEWENLGYGDDGNEEFDCPCCSEAALYKGFAVGFGEGAKDVWDLVVTMSDPGTYKNIAIAIAYLNCCPFIATPDAIQYRENLAGQLKLSLSELNNWMNSSWDYSNTNENCFNKGKQIGYALFSVIGAKGAGIVLKNPITKQIANKTLQIAKKGLEKSGLASKMEKAVFVTTSVRFVAKTGVELKAYLTTIATKPLAKNYKCKFFKSVSKNAELNHNAKPNVISEYSIEEAWGRYDTQGESGMYYSESFEGNKTEMSHYNDWNSFSTYEYAEVNVRDILDLTDDQVRQKLGTDVNSLVLGMSDKTKAYEFTNVLGTWARENGYKGLRVPGARGAKDYINIIIFEQSELNTLLNGITPIPHK